MKGFSGLHDECDERTPRAVYQFLRDFIRIRVIVVRIQDVG